MNYYFFIQKAIDFIEDHLYENISTENIADSIGFSVSHFHRIFSSLVGETPKSYIRKRRISMGALMMKKSDMKICDIAFQVGFESHEVFLRAFKRIYGVSPRKIKSSENFALYEKFDTESKKKNLENGVIILDTKIIVKDSFNILGRTTELNQADQVQDNLIDDIFKQFKEVKQSLSNSYNKNKIFSLYEYDPATLTEDDEKIDYLYTIGVESHCNEEISKDFILKRIPQSKYAVFVHNIKERTLNGVDLSTIKYEGRPISNIYDYIDGIWILNSGHTVSSNPDFEIRCEDAPNVVEYYISII